VAKDKIKKRKGVEGGGFRGDEIQRTEEKKATRGRKKELEGYVCQNALKLLGRVPVGAPQEKEKERERLKVEQTGALVRRSWEQRESLL